MVIDGKAIAEEIYKEIRVRVSELSKQPRLTIITCAPNFETQKYLALKKKKAAAVGIETNVVELSEESTTDDFLRVIHTNVSSSSGIIVQLPLPAHIDNEAVLHAVPTTHDVDALNPETTEVLSPVVGALKAILEHHGISPHKKFVTIIGSGKLVGLPAYEWFLKEGAYVSVVTKETPDIQHATQNADIIVCGAGVPDLLTPEMVKDGVIILDAGTSEAGGQLRGDADPLCAHKASFFTPVPGGIGPITIAVLMKNMLEISH